MTWGSQYRRVIHREKNQQCKFKADLPNHVVFLYENVFSQVFWK